MLLFISCFASEVKGDTVLTTTVKFNINTSSVVYGDPGYEYLHSYMIPFMEENIEYLDRVELIGSSSPDGPKSLNDNLSRVRAESLSGEFNIPKSKIFVSNVGENYDRLVDLVEDENDKDTLLSILSSGINVKKRIKKYNTLYPQIRTVDVKIYFNGINIFPCDTDTVFVNDTIYVDEIDTVICDSVYIEKPFKRIPIVALKTNLLSDLLITPNIQAEIYTHLWGISIEFEYTFPWYHNDNIYWYYQIMNGTAGIRKYFSDDYSGHYVGIYGSTFVYDVCFNKEKGYQGEGWNVGLGYGYVFKYKKHQRLKFEPYIRIGYMHTNFDTYHASEPFDGKYYYNWYRRASEFVPRRFELNYFGPTMIGFNITYDLICVRKY